MKLLAPLARILALTFIVSFAGLAMFQDSLLYYPERASVAELVRGIPGARPWPAAEDFRALVVEPAQHKAGDVGEVRATLVVFHGNAGHAGHRGFYAETLAPLGVRVILAEYPGYGPRDGEFGEASLVADAAATIAAVRREFPGPLLVLGESLGAGVAAAASKQVGHEGIAGIVLVTPWDTLANVAAHHYPWLPRSLLAWGLRDRYDSVANLSAAAFRGRVAVVLAERDSIVPAVFGQALFDRLPGEKRRFVIAGADHNDWPDRVDAAWWREVLSSLLPSSSPAGGR